MFGRNPRVAVGVATGAAAKSAGSHPYAENGVLCERVMREHENTHPFASLVNRDVRTKTLILRGEVGAAASSGV